MSEKEERLPVCAGVVCYNPDKDRLDKNLEKLNEQVDSILVIDNNSENRDDITETVEKYNCELLLNLKNMGVATAYNQIFEYFKDRYEWILIMDQDSVIPDGMVNRFRKIVLSHANSKIGIICPSAKCKNDDELMYIFSEKDLGGNIYKIPYCISSASLNSVKAWEDVCGFDENLFIDFVDIDFCYSIRENGYSVVQVKDYVLDHELGDLKVKRIFRRKIRVMNYPAWRKFYYARNAIICKKKHRLCSRTGIMRDIIVCYIKTLLYEERKYEKIVQLTTGLFAGLKYKKI